ncbi:MAG: SpoIIE family protein phosphatase, partial [Bacteroidia bacterium]
YSAKSGNRANTASVYNNIGIVFNDMGNVDSSLVYAFKALEIRKQLRNEDVQQTLGTSYSNIAILYMKKKDYAAAEKYYMLSYDEDLANNDMNSLAKTLGNLGDFYYQKGDYSKALKYLGAAQDTAKNIGLTPLLLDVYWNYFCVYKKIDKYKEAAEYMEKYAVLKDSLDGVKNHEVLEEMQTRYETEKKEQQIDLLNKDNLLKETQLNDEKMVRYFMFGFIAVVVISSVFIYNAYRNKKRANELLKEKNTEIQRQRNLLGEKNKEILDSINYAKNLQDAILPSLAGIRKHLPGTFIFYKPKDIVAGDFYWFFHSGNALFIAAADCTGHGVPGAMVSMVCTNALNKVVKEQSIKDPGEILNAVKDIVVETYSKSAVKDGMDISLASITKQGNETKVLWAGANNPLWYIKDGSFAEIKADKQPIGKFDYSKPFTTHAVSLSTGDNLFFITDGYADQFGGPKGKKFKYAQLKELLCKNAALSPEEQEHQLIKEFNDWSTGHLQVDDVTIIGIRL